MVQFIQQDFCRLLSGHGLFERLSICSDFVSEISGAFSVQPYSVSLCGFLRRFGWCGHFVAAIVRVAMAITKKTFTVADTPVDARRKKESASTHRKYPATKSQMTLFDRALFMMTSWLPGDPKRSFGSIYWTCLSALAQTARWKRDIIHHCMNDPNPEGHMASYIRRRKFLATLSGRGASS